MISFFRYITFVLILCAITGCVFTKTYKRDKEATTEILWNYHNRLIDIELEQIKRILEERIDRFEKGTQLKQNEFDADEYLKMIIPIDK